MAEHYEHALHRIRNDESGFTKGVLVGTVAGIGLALLFAPKRAAELREQFLAQVARRYQKTAHAGGWAEQSAHAAKGHPSGATDKTFERETKFDDEGGDQPQAPSQRAVDKELDKALGSSTPSPSGTRPHQSSPLQNHGVSNGTGAHRG